VTFGPSSIVINAGGADAEEIFEKFQAEMSNIIVQDNYGK